jgi:hypothetical protein
MSSQGTLASLRRRIASTGLPGGAWDPTPGPSACPEGRDPLCDDDALTLFRARLADGDEVEFARHLRTRCIHSYWLLISAARLAETVGELRTGVGRGTFDLPLTITCLALWLFFAIDSRAPASDESVSRKIVDLSHYLVLAYMSVRHALMLVYLMGLSESQGAEERRNLYECSARPAYYAFCFLLGFFMPLTCSGEAKFQAAFVGENLGASLGLIRVAGADPRRFAPQLGAWTAAVVASNVCVYGVLKPLWIRAQARVTSDLRQRVEQLGREKERITWELQLEAKRSRDRGGGVPGSATEPESTRPSVASSFVRDVQALADRGRRLVLAGHGAAIIPRWRSAIRARAGKTAPQSRRREPRS